MARKKYRKFFGKGPLDYLPKLDLDPETKKGIFIVLVLALGAISFLSLFGLAGTLGEYLLSGISFLFGWGRWVFPILLLAWGFLLYREQGVRGYVYLGGVMFSLSLLALMHIINPSNEWQRNIALGKGGGYFGYYLASSMVNLAGLWGALILLLALFFVSLMTMFNKTLTGLFGADSIIGKILFPIRWLVAKIFNRKDEPEEEGAEEDEQEEAEEEPTEQETEEDAEEDNEDEETKDENEEENDDKEEEFTRKHLPGQAALPIAAAAVNIWQPSNVKINIPLDLLSGKIGKPTAGDVKSNVETIRRTMEHFGIPVEMGEVTVGPTVAQYTFKPADGIMLSKIVALNNNLSLALAAHPIRIEAPIPKKSLVGIEVPNQATATVGLRELLESDQFTVRKSSLMVPLGKDVGGKIWFYDLVKMPHLLVAGQTNSGKSVCLNSIIVGLLYQNNPDDLRLVLIDPKRVGMAMFDGLPHLLAPVITEADKTINAMRWCINEMDRRFDILAKYHQANIQEYNQFAVRQKKISKLPYLVFVIDELADLKTVAAKDIEAGIVRLAQKGRAAGIHLIIATQRPDVTVITGLIKANLPARIAFAVTSGVDSKTILDGSGAENLLGKGDMLFINAEMAKPVRIQGAFVNTAEIKKVVSHIRQQAGELKFIEDLTRPQKVKGMAPVAFDGGGGDSDDLLEEAKEAVINAGRASTSYLQRRLGIGYGRAAKILDLLEEQGVIGPPNGSKPREVMVSREEYEATISQGVSGVSLHNRDEAEAPDEFLKTDDEVEEDDDGEEDKEDAGEDEEDEGDDEQNEEEDEDTDEEEDNNKEAEDKDEPVKNKMKLDDVYSEEEPPASAKPKKIAKPGDDDFDKLFSR